MINPRIYIESKLTFPDHINTYKSTNDNNCRKIELFIRSFRLYLSTTTQMTITRAIFGITSTIRIVLIASVEDVKLYINKGNINVRIWNVKLEIDVPIQITKKFLFLHRLLNVFCSGKSIFTY